VQGWALVQASYAPLAVLIVAGLLGASVELAVTISMISSTCLLVGFGWVAGRRGGLTGLRLILAALFSGFLGLVLIGLKLSLH